MNVIVSACHGIPVNRIYGESLRRFMPEARVILLGEPGGEVPQEFEKRPAAGVSPSILLDRFHTLLRLDLPRDAVVFFCDSRDTAFQGDIFTAFKEKPVLFAENANYRLGFESANANWLCWVNDGKYPVGFQDKPILCAGAMLGRLADLQEHALDVVDVMNGLEPRFGVDQGAHNLVAYRESGRYEFATNELGPVFHMALRSPFNLDGGQVWRNNLLPTVLHQYDRHPEVVKMLEGMYAHPG